MPEFLTSGGYMMIPLLLSSVIGVVFIIERLLTLRRNKVIPRQLTQVIHQIKSENDIQNLRNVCVADKSLFAGLIVECVDNRHLNREELKEFMEDQGRHAIHSLQKGMGALEAIGGTAPLMGLLGTIFGMIKVFHTINQMGAGQTKALSGGISEALITTATGLIIAIPILLFYYYFNGKSEDLIIQIEKELVLLINKLKKPGQ